MNVNGTVKMICSQCKKRVDTCDDCREPFMSDDFVSCCEPNKHICEACYEDSDNKALNPELLR